MFSLIKKSAIAAGEPLSAMAAGRKFRTSGSPNGTRLDCPPGGRELGEHGTSKFNGTWMDCPLGGREFGEDGASNGMGLDCLPGGRELGTLDASNGTWLDYLPSGREPGLERALKCTTLGPPAYAHWGYGSG